MNTSTASSRATIITTVGFMCLGLMIWMVSMSSAGWFDKVYPDGVAMLMLFVILGIIAILAFLDQRTLDAVIFFGGAGLFGAVHVIYAGTGAGSQPMHYSGWFDLLWAVFFFYVWLAALKADTVRMLFLLGMWLTGLAFALAGWGLGQILEVIGGYIGLATAILALVVSACAITGRGPAASGA
jgi:uncharacterized protein